MVLVKQFSKQNYSRSSTEVSSRSNDILEWPETSREYRWIGSQDLISHLTIFTNFVEDISEPRKFISLSNRNTYKNSFITRTVTDWNSLPANVIDQATVETFKAALKEHFIKLE